MGYHVQQAIVFASLWIRYLNPWTQYFAVWLAGGDSVTVDDSHNIFNMDCLASVSFLQLILHRLTNISIVLAIYD